MERRWEGVKPFVLQMLTAGVIATGSVLLLPVLEGVLGALGRIVGMLIGDAVGAVLHVVLSALGVFVPATAPVQLHLPGGPVTAGISCLLDRTRGGRSG